MFEKHSRFMWATGFRGLLTVGAMSGCGLSQMYAGNGPSRPKDPMQEIAAIQYNKSGQLRTDFTDNRKFVELLLKASDEYVKVVTAPATWKDPKSWRPAIEAYRAAFKELKDRLQGKWRDIFGNGPSRFPWNGHSDGATDLWREDDLRRDMPVVLSLWDPWGDWGHICRTKVLYYCNPVNTSQTGFHIPNDNKAYVPNNSPAYVNRGAINDGKDKYKAYVLEFFNASRLSKCKKYLEKFFCAPVSQLLVQGSVCLQEAGFKDCRKDLQLLLSLYADYYSLDSVVAHNRRYRSEGAYVALASPMGLCCDDCVKTTKYMVQLMVACYSNYEQWDAEDQKWLCSLLDNLDANYYVKENLHTYCIQSYDLLRGYRHTDIKFSSSFYTYGNVSVGTQGYHIETAACKGLRDVFKKRGNPLPEVTWQKFVNYAGRRWSLVLETMSWGEYIGGLFQYRGPNDANTVLHRSKTFDQVPCSKEVLEEMSGQEETDIKK